MTPALFVDGLILLALLAAIVIGWRQGAFASVLSTVGVVAGLILGAVLAPPVMQLTESVALRFLLGLGTIILLVGLGNLIGGILGSSLRERMRMRSSQTIDSAIGALFTTAATLIVIWLISIPLATGLTGTFSQGIRGSAVLGFVDRSTPPGLEQLPARITVLLDESGLPPIFAPFDEPPAREVAAPNIQIEDHALVERVRPSVVHIQGDSDQCSRRLMGSGFVTDTDYVITNAHVVAGTQSVRLDTVLGVKDAEVVYYNPGVDIAVLHSPGLNLPALNWAAHPAGSGEDAIVMGFPESGPFEAAPARVREQLLIAGPDIYAAGRVERDAYTVRGTIRQGNSGGPLLDTDGAVLGVVFGASVDQTDTGYVLTAAEVRRQVGDVTALRAPVGTQECVAR
ncbi:MarP family serine protease [Corynebacterium nasicanis]|uniref:MarP family serine protease n=1 Tax=Corynebacterium nasicanis TaxID=1448267 RepID=A0ABW1QE29_9CORY